MQAPEAAQAQEGTVKASPRFWNMIARRYARQPVADEETYQRKLAVTRRYLRPDMEVLEFGCGTGSTAIAHAPFVRHILATDISARMIGIARGKAAEAGVGNVTFEQKVLDDVDAPDGSVDAVLGLNILHLVEDRDAAIRRVHRLLKPGGVFVSSTACLGDSPGFAWLRVVGPVGHALGLLPLLRLFTTGQLVESLTGAGFSIDHQWRPGRGKAVFIVAHGR